MTICEGSCFDQPLTLLRLTGAARFTRFFSRCFVASIQDFSGKPGNAAAGDRYFSALQIVEVLRKVAVGSAKPTRHLACEFKSSYLTIIPVGAYLSLLQSDIQMNCDRGASPSIAIPAACLCTIAIFQSGSTHHPS
ncbi:MAG: hypothetical protein LH628_07275 [Microcoleus sp. CAN_BIN18]|nr:hypothetical protein [Microcoleus sp. CAN_BIN18]